MKKTIEIEKYLQYRKKIRVLKYAQDFGARDACETFGVTKTTFYNWKNKFDKYVRKVCRERSEIQRHTEIDLTLKLLNLF
jgi:hypothetical protein